MKTAKTSLARQLELLKLPQTSVHKEKHGSASFIYDFFEAKSINLDTHYSVALVGLEGLIKIDPYVETFKESLFNESSKNFDRAVESSETNEKINHIIEEYLFRVVSKYFQLSDTHKTIEWLIYRYKINEYNTDALIGSVIPYHETRLFVRLLQTCSALKDPQNSRWFWLKSVQESGIPLAKSILFAHCVKNIDFIRFITDSVFKAMQIDGENTIFPSFFVSFCYNILERINSDITIALIVSALSKALRMKNKFLYIASYMIFSHLCTVTELDQQVVQKLLKSLMRRFSTDTVEGALLAFNIVCKTQELEEFPVEFVTVEFISNLTNLASTYNFEYLILALFGTMISAIKNEESEDDDSQLELYKNYSRQLFEISSGICENTIVSIIKMIDDKIESKSSSLSSEANELYSYVVRLIEKLFPSWFDLAVGRLESVANISPLLNSLRYTFVKDAQVPLFIGLEHSNSRIRRRSILFFAENFKKFSKNVDDINLIFLKHTVQTNLLADLNQVDPDTFIEIFSIKQKIFNLFNPKEFELIASQILNYCDEYLNKESDEMMNVDNVDADKWAQVKSILLNIYFSRSSTDYATQSSIYDKFFSSNNHHLNLLNYLIPLKYNHLAGLSSILDSKYTESDQQLMQQIKSASTSCMKKYNKKSDSFSEIEQLELVKEFSKVIIDKIVEYLVANLNRSIDELDKFRDLIELIKSDSSGHSRRRSICFLLVLINLYKNRQLNNQQRCSVGKFIVDILFNLFDVMKLKTRTLINILDFSQYDDSDTVFSNCLLELSEFSSEKLPISFVGFVLHSLIGGIDFQSSTQIGSNQNHSSLSIIDWQHYQLNSTFNFYFKLYQLLIYFSTPNANKPLPKKTLKLFRNLSVLFLHKIICPSFSGKMEEVNGCSSFIFFLPIIATKSQFQVQTLSLLHNMLQLSQTSTNLIESFKQNPYFILAYLIALSSKLISVRQQAILNLKIIHKLIPSDDDDGLKTFVKNIVDNEESILANEKYIDNFLNVDDSELISKSSFASKLSQVIVELLTGSESDKLSTSFKVSLINLLNLSNVSTKAKVLQFYYDKFFPQEVPVKSLSFSDELELKSLLSFYEGKKTNLFETPDDNQKSCFVNFYLATVRASERILSEELSLLAYSILTRSRFESICQTNEEVAIHLVSSLLCVQLNLSESGSSVIINNLVLINAIKKRLRRITYNGVFIVQLLSHLLPIDEIYDNFAYAKKDVPSVKRSRVDTETDSKFANGWKLLRIYVSLFQNKDNLENTSVLVKTLFDYLKLTFMDVGDNSNEYTRQTILYAIVSCIEQKLTKKLESIKHNRIKQGFCDDNDDTDDINKMDIDQLNDTTSLAEFLSKINVDIIVDCMRESRLKETQKVSLLLISLIAPHFQKQILEYLVAIFTFIGTSLLQCDDQYSLAILFETMESIIPIILENDKPDKLKTIGKKSDFDESDMKQYIVSIFVKSFSDIPSYRRLALFTKLIQLLGEDKYLTILSVRLLEQSCLLKSKTSQTEKEVCVTFLYALFGQFPLDIQITSLCSLLGLFESKFFDHHLKKKSLQKHLVEIRNDDSMEDEDSPKVDLLFLKKLSHSVSNEFATKMMYDSDKLSCGVELLRFIVSLISSTEFVEAIHKVSWSQVSTLLIYFINLVIELIVTLSPSDSSMKQNLNVYRKRIKSALDEMLLKFNVLLPHETLIEIVIVDLLNNSVQFDQTVSTLIQRKALELLNDKLMTLKPNDLKNKVSKKIIKAANRYLPSESDDLNQLNDLQIHNIQLIMLSLKLTTKFLEPTGDDSTTTSHKTIAIFSNVLQRLIQMVSSIGMEHSESPSDIITHRAKLMQNLKGSCILCISQILSTMSLEGIQYLSDVVNIVLKNFEVKDDIILISNVSALAKIIQKFAQFLSPHLKEIILKLLHSFTLCDQIKNLRSKLQNIWTNMAKLVPKRVIFVAIDDSYEEATLDSPESIVQLMSLFRLSCDNIEKSDVEIIVKSFKNFMIKALSYRSTHHSKVDSELIERIEASFGEAFSAFIPKLTESTFRPIFYRLLDWSIQIQDLKVVDESDSSCSLPDDCYYRMIAFYRFCSLLAERLKSLFCVFVAPSILNNCSEMLLAYHSSNFKSDEEDEAEAEDGFVSADQKKSKENQLKLKDAHLGDPLISSILSTLSKCFLYDLNGTFVNKDCTSLIIKPIVNQISNLFGTEVNYNSRLDLILQCTQYLIQNNKDETLIKEFNYQILLKTRETNEKIRFGAIKVLHRLILTCSEDYLPFIPEAIPFIAELSEDESELVESQVKKLIIDIEQLVGEPISKYL